jgi:hypothetical protein
MPIVESAVLVEVGLLEPMHAYWASGQAPLWFGPIEYGGYKWLAVVTFPPGGHAAYHFYKSTDGGFSWAVQDEADAPDLVGRINLVYAGSGLWHAATLVTSTGDVRLRDFNMATGQWGSDYGAFNLSPDIANFDAAMGMARFSDGTILLVYMQQTGSTTSYGVGYRIWNGSSWSAETLITGLSSSQAWFWRQFGVTSIVVDDNDRAHVFIKDAQMAGTSALHYVQIRADGSHDAAETAQTFASWIDDINRSAVYDPANDEVIISVQASGQLGVIRGTPSSNPVFGSLEVAYSGSSYYGQLVVSVERNYSTLYLGFLNDGFGGDEIYLVANGGSGWSAPSLAQSAILHPPTMPDGWEFSGYHHISGTLYPGGVIGWYAGSYLTVPELGAACDVVMYVETDLGGADLAGQSDGVSLVTGRLEDPLRGRSDGVSLVTGALNLESESESAGETNNTMIVFQL